MKFTKMHGIGNDFIYINCLTEKIENPFKHSKFLCDRHFGIGADGLILIMNSDIADFKVIMYNSDGSQMEMCGNGIRCIGKYVYDNNLINKSNITIETAAGIKQLELSIKNNKVENIKVDMGIPILKSSEIPTNINQEHVINYPVNIFNHKFNITCVSMGNPHTVIFIDGTTDKFNFEDMGRAIENYNLFPNKTNVEFATMIDKNNIQMRVWERGVGETLACGTGACATLVSAVLNNYCDRSAMIHLKGGDLFIEWNEDNHIYMTGPATKIYDGEIDFIL